MLVTTHQPKMLLKLKRHMHEKSISNEGWWEKNDTKEKTQRNEKIWGKLLIVYRKNMSQNLFYSWGTILA